jgi:hypothetical protein
MGCNYFFWKKLVTFGVAVGQRVAVNKWQWYGSIREVGAVRMVVKSARQRHYRQCYGVNTTVVVEKGNGWKKRDGRVTFGAAVGQRVAVDKWQWYQSIREVSAVRMVPILTCQWQY